VYSELELNAGENSVIRLSEWRLGSQWAINYAVTRPTLAM